MSSLSVSMPGNIDIEACISQRNMDYSIFKALSFKMDGIEAASFATMSCVNGVFI